MSQTSSPQSTFDQPIAALYMSRSKVVFGILVTIAFGTLLSLIALRIWQLHPLSGMLVFAGAGIIFYLAYALSQTANIGICLYPDRLCDTNGRVLTTLANIDTLILGTFAAKPTQGFLVILKKNRKIAWQPGLWWCFRRRLGIGGSTSRGATTAFAEQLKMQIANLQSPFT